MAHALLLSMEDGGWAYMHESKHVSRGGSVGRAGRRTADCRGHRRDSGVGVGHPEEAISILRKRDSY